MLGRLRTNGGEVFVLNGTNFGPAYPRSFISFVKLGSAIVPSCEMTIPHRQLKCATVAGVGQGHRWQVSVLQQTAVSSDVVDYKPPTIVSTMPSTVSTDGGLISVIGMDFGAEHGQIVLLCNGSPVSSFTLQVSVDK